MSERRSFITLDGLRGVAALALVARHVPPFSAHPMAQATLYSTKATWRWTFFCAERLCSCPSYGDRLLSGMSTSALWRLGSFVFTRSICLP